MHRGGIGLMGAGLLLVGYFAGRTVGPVPLEFPDRDRLRSAAEMEHAVGEALGQPRAFARAVSMVRLFEGLTRENVEGAARAVSGRAGRWDPIDLQLFLTAWVNIDPVAAVQEVEGWPIRSLREIGLKITMREWAASGHWLEAVDYFQTAIDPELRGIAAGPLVRGWALAGDFDGALDLAHRLWETEGRLNVVDGYVRGVLHVAGPEVALDIARRSDPTGGGEFEQRLARVTLDLVVREDPAAAALLYQEFVSEVTPEWLDGTLERLVGIWRNQDSQAALTWLLELEANETRDRLLSKTMADWGIRDLDAAWDWFEAARGPLDEAGLLGSTDSRMLLGLFPKMSRTRPAQAAEWAMRLQPESARNAMLMRVANFWSLDDPSAASDWIEGLKIPSALRERLRQANKKVSLARERETVPKDFK